MGNVLMSVYSQIFKKEKDFTNLISTLQTQSLEKRKLPVVVTGLCEGALVCFLATLASSVNYSRPSLIITDTEKDASKVNTHLCNLGYKSMFYPVRDPIFYDVVSSHDIEHERINVLTKILSGDIDFVVTVPEATLQYTIPNTVLSKSCIVIKKNSEINLDNLVDFLIDAGYSKCDLVSGKGQFSIRGGIIDIFSPSYNQPIRIELFGDDIDSISFFDLTTQRRKEKLSKAIITCAKEILLSNEGKENLIDILKQRTKKITNENSKKILNSEIEILSYGTGANFLDKYIQIIYPEKMSLLDYLPNDTLVMVNNTKDSLIRLNSYITHENQTISSLIEAQEVIGKYASFTKDESYFHDFIEANLSVLFLPFLANIPYRQSGLFSFTTRPCASYSGNYDTLKEDIDTYIRANDSILLLAGSKSEANALYEYLSNNEISAQVVYEFNDIVSLPKKVVVITIMELDGFELPLSNFACISLCERLQLRKKISGRNEKLITKKDAKNKFLSYTELTPGDYVVHDNHGICKFECVVRMKNFEGVIKDYIKLQFAGTDTLYVPCEHIDIISKYVGVTEGENHIKLSSLGSKDWQKAKTKVKSQVKDIAKDLIAIYAQRMRLPGYAFMPDDEEQIEFESLFEYEETDAQIIASREIKDDMEKPIPMDRLLCGDVGFGKTEVALRAAFKCVNNGKQVAFLAPTTILALQHYQTTQVRMRNFPVNVALLTRFTKPNEMKTILNDVKRGVVDILIGTHRILSNDIEFKDLGLLIVDEEQRFGVTHKEKLKKLGNNIDVLTLTATPIPRTLNMAMNDIRDLSILDEAPVDRVPVQTYVLEYSFPIIEEAIRRELRRGGQVFYLYNRIESMPKVVSKLKEAFPNYNVSFAHGGLEKDNLNSIWQKMVSGEIDILVCTTIIETGVDIPNANTLIIENADLLGLSQLHQIRGRVGRSSRKAYAYFTYSQDVALNEDAVKRLEVIRDFTEFGSGFSIALKDLEIRGAGDLLGSSQHGHMNSVGYDMYIKLLNEAVLEEQGKVIKPKSDCTINISRDSYIPNKYIPSENQRMLMYKKIGAIESEEDLDIVADEFIDRYGDMPNSVENLLNVSLIRYKASLCNLIKIEQKNLDIFIYSNSFDIKDISELSLSYRYKMTILMDFKIPCIKLSLDKNENVFDTLKKFLDKYYQILSK